MCIHEVNKAANHLSLFTAPSN